MLTKNSNFILFFSLIFCFAIACKDKEPEMNEQPGPKFKETCCTHSAIVDSVGSAEVFIPNNFTANFDGINDVFVVWAGQEISHIISMKIFDDAENLVFEHYDFQGNDPAEGWDGKLPDGNLEDGIFNYVIEISNVFNETKTFEGTVACRTSFPLNCVDHENQCVFGTQHDGNGGYDGALPNFEDCQ